jgi:hypothetical protein
VKKVYYLGVQIRSDGTFIEVFNGPGNIAAEAVKGRSKPKTNLPSVSVSALKKLQLRVNSADCIPRRGPPDRASGHS